MAGLTCRKKGAKDKAIRKANLKTKRYTRDVDQIVHTDMLPKNTVKLLNQEMDEYKPGLGQFYCVVCARYFISYKALEAHLKTKEHKKRVKTCSEIPYSQAEADMAAGLKSSHDMKFVKAIYAGKTKMADVDGMQDGI